ncbi:peptide transporter PTR2 [Iris pallida]|uniref:Peptide transporter PTR2 n=1 Tax=Iris pallida TaxID=29817 RepID=A0AAX6GNW7_IRIPA|nr:peptide transporter PTR2 [Iris pallida]
MLILCALQGVSLLTVATTLSSMRPPACADPRGQCVAASGRQLALLYASLYTVALGAGGIKANVSGFGSDQFDAGDAGEGKAMVFFFNRFYFCISLGSLFAVTVLVYVQDNVGRGYGYGASAAAMVLAVLVLAAGTPRYRFRRAQGSPLAAIGRVAYLAWKKRKVPYPPHESHLNEYQSAEAPHTRRLRCLDKAAIITSKGETGGGGGGGGGGARSSVSMAATVNQVEEVKMVLKLLPIWSTCILFWTVYSQMTTFSVEQATYMDRNIGSSFVFPSGSLSFFLIVTVLLVTSLNERLLVPVARRFTRSAHGLTSLQRVAVGLAFSTAAMAAAAVVEARRRESAARDGAARMSVFWLVPQYFLVGAGEAFAYVGQLEFFIREAPERMKSMSTGLFLASISMGFFLSSLLVSLVDAATGGGWIKNDLDDGRLDCFYWMLAVLGVVNFVVFLLFASGHEYKVQSYGTKDQGLASNGWKKEETINDAMAMHVAEEA